MQLSELRTEILNRINNDTDLGTNTNLNRWINLAQDEVESRVLGRILRSSGNFSTEATVSTYSIIEPQFRSFLQLWQTETPAALTQLDPRQFRRIYPDPTTQDVPLWWMFLGFASGFPQIQLYFIPNGVYTINYEILLNLPDLSNDADESIISSYGYDELLIQGAFVRYLQVRDPTRAIVERGRYEELIRQYNRARQSEDLNPMSSGWQDSMLFGSTLRLPVGYPQTL